jgi:class III poly(R)-hydroxyalkanoic acid synthase PhaE subunit
VTDNAKSSAAWSQVWMDAQRRYWDSWVDLWGKGARQGERNEQPWQSALDLWSQAAQALLPEHTRGVAQKLFDVNRGFAGLGEAFFKTMQGLQPGAGPGADWPASLQKVLEQLRAGLAGGMGTQGDPWAGFATFWGMPLDNWRRVCSACSLLPGDMTRALRGEGPPYAALHGAMSQALSTPPLGYTREWQEQVQEWGQLWLKHGEALQRYQSLLNKVGSRAVDLLQEKLRQLGEENKTPDTLRAAYDLWVDCGEEAYGELANTEEFTQAQAHLANTLMAVKRHEQQMVEEMQAALNMPTRRELDTTHRRVHELRRELRAVREELAELRATAAGAPAATETQGEGPAAGERRRTQPKDKRG